MTLKKAVISIVIILGVAGLAIIIIGAVYAFQSTSDESKVKIFVREYLNELQNQQWDRMLLQTVNENGDKVTLDDLQQYISSEKLDSINGMDTSSVFMSAYSTKSKWTISFVYEQISFKIICRKVNGEFLVCIQ